MEGAVAAIADILLAVLPLIFSRIGRQTFVSQLERFWLLSLP
jgi:hypothetical protein